MIYISRSIYLSLRLLWHSKTKNINSYYKKYIFKCLPAILSRVQSQGYHLSFWHVRGEQKLCVAHMLQLSPLAGPRRQHYYALFKCLFNISFCLNVIVAEICFCCCSFFFLFQIFCLQFIFVVIVLSSSSYQTE